MKIQVMIVEDEPIIRQGIASVIPWESIGCQVAALAENGLDGLEKARQCRPRLVISDIRMPRLDGLEMAEQLTKLCPGVKIVLLTGYKEFEYAQRAISFGVSDYILKPVDQDELLSTVEKLAKEIQKEDALEQERELLKTRVRESLPILKDKFISSLLFSSLDNIYNVYEKMAYFQLEIRRFAIFAIEIDSFHELEMSFTEDDIQILLFLIAEQTDGLLPEYGYSSITFQHGNSVYAILGSSERELEEHRLPECGQELEERIRERGRFTVSIGISRIYEGAEQLRRARQEADKCVSQSAYLGAGSVVCSQDLQEVHGKAELPELNTELFYDCLKQGSGIKKEAEAIGSRLSRAGDTAFAKSSAAELISKSLRQLIEDYGESGELSEAFDRFMEKLYHSKSVRNFESLVLEAGEWMEQYVCRRRLNRTEYLMDKAVQYMRENCRRELTLEEVADEVYVSKWYFSKLFRKEKGIKFSDYLSALRIEQAQKIIRENPGLKNYEVADLVGFADVRYFSQLFKKITGKTPSEYRGKAG